jgi:hypothetical protein
MSKVNYQHRNWKVLLNKKLIEKILSSVFDARILGNYLTVTVNILRSFDSVILCDVISL